MVRAREVFAFGQVSLGTGQSLCHRDAVRFRRRVFRCREHVEYLISSASRAQTYEEYVRYKTPLAGYPALRAISQLGFNVDVQPEEERRRRPRSAWTNYAPEYLDTLEKWLRELRR